jgi:hypothetical protein
VIKRSCLITLTAILFVSFSATTSAADNLKNDPIFQSACNSSTNLREWRDKKVCWCSGHYTKVFTRMVSRKYLESNPNLVRQPDASNYSELARLSKNAKASGSPLVESDIPRKTDGSWGCAASFFGFVTGNGSLDLDWRGR